MNYLYFLKFLFSEVSDVLNWIARSRISIEGESREFPREFTLLDIFGERRVVNVSSWDQVLRRLDLHDPFLNQLVKGMEIWRSIALGSPACVELFWRVVTWVWNCWLSSFSSSCSRRMFSQSSVIRSCSQADCSCCSFICSLISWSIWKR